MSSSTEKVCRNGSASDIIDASVTILDDSDYYPYGGEIAITNNDGNNYKFTGKEWDSESAAEGTTSSFQGMNATQQEAASAIRNIMSNPSRVVRGAQTMDIYNAAGQGVRIENGTNRFIGFLEASKATR